MAIPEMHEFPIDAAAAHNAPEPIGIAALDEAPFKSYIGTKLISAKPFPGNEGQAGYQVVYDDGYKSWSPRAAFEAAYQSLDLPGLTFGHALELLKSGAALRRAGWNGKGMFIYLNRGSKDFPEDEAIPVRIEGIRSDLFDHGDVQTSTRLPNINMATPTGSIVTGWLASQTDLLAEDWQVVY